MIRRSSQFGEMQCDWGDDDGVSSLRPSIIARNAYYQEGSYDQYTVANTAVNDCKLSQIQQTATI